MTRIFIEGKEIDIAEDMTMDLNYAIADIMELDKRNTQFSKTISIPDTIYNREVFGYFCDIAVQNPYVEALPNIGLNFNPTKKAQCVIYKDNIAVFKGICRMISVTSNDGDIRYEINLFGRLKDILYELGDTYIHELDWTNQNFVYTSANFFSNYDFKEKSTGTSSTTSGQDFCYPMVDYGDVVDLDAWDWKQFKPAVFIRQILIRMFEYAGFVANPALFAPFFDTEYFRRLILVNGEKGIIQYLKEIVEYQVTQQGYQNPCTTPSVCTFSHWSPLTQIVNNGGLFTYVSPATTECGSPLRHSLQYNGTAPITVDVSFDLKVRWRFERFSETCSDPNTGQTFPCFVASYGVFGTVFIGITDAAGAFQNVLYTRSKQFIVPPYNVTTYEEEWIITFNQQVTFQPGQMFTILGQANYCPAAGLTSAPRAGDLKIDWSSNGYDGRIKIGFPVITAAPVSIGSTIVFSDILPRGIKCVDLFKSIILMHNLYVEQDDNQENLLHITPHPLYYDYDITKAADWTDKLDTSSEIKIIPLSELKAQRYKFTYESDNDYFSEAYAKKFNEQYGEKIEYIENDFLDTQEEIKVIFSPCVIVKPDDTDRIYMSLYKLDGTTKKPDKFKPRIAYFNNSMETAYIWAIYDGASLLRINLDYNYAGHLDNPITPTLDINFGTTKEVYFEATLVTGNNLYESFWKKLIAEISDKDSRLLIASFDLKGYDVENIDFARLIKVGTQYFKLIKIENFNPEGDTLAKVHLLKVLYDTNFGELNYILQEDNPYLLQENGTNRFYI
jgi:hypothetical protein